MLFHFWEDIRFILYIPVLDCVQIMQYTTSSQKTIHSKSMNEHRTINTITVTAHLNKKWFENIQDMRTNYNYVYYLHYSYI